MSVYDLQASVPFFDANPKCCMDALEIFKHSQLKKFDNIGASN